MQIELQQEELKKLLHCVFLGNYVINGCREPSQVIEGYKVFERKIYMIYYEACHRGFEVAEENELADIRDRVYDELAEYIDQFEYDIWIEKTAELVAEKEFSFDACDEIRMRKRFIAEMLFKERLQQEGCKIVNVDFYELNFKLAKRILVKGS